jgi:hypothetical protein
MYVAQWNVPYADEPVTIHGTADYYPPSGISTPSPAGLTIAIGVRNDATGVTNSTTTETDANGDFSFVIPGSWHPTAGPYMMNVFMQYSSGQVVGGNTYVMPTGYDYSHTYAVVAETYDTATTLVLFKGSTNYSPLATDVGPGDPLYLEVSVAVNNPGGANDDYAISGAAVGVTLTYPDNTSKTFPVYTDSTGIGWYNLTSILSATSKYGHWALSGNYAGAQVGAIVYNPSTSSTVGTTVSALSTTCNDGDTKCVDTQSMICNGGAWVLGGDACTNPIGPVNDIVIIGAVAGLAAVGVALIVLGTKKGKKV